MNHKRKKPKNARAGCLMCKDYKQNGAKGLRRKATNTAYVTRQEASANEDTKEQLRDG